MTANPKDTTVEGRLDQIADNLETLAGIDPGAARRDWTIPAILDRINNAVSAGTFEAHSIGAHTDTAIAAAIAGHILEYDGAAWINKFQALDSHGDVALGSLVVNDYLSWDGTNWVNGPITVGHLPALELDDLSDVTMGGGPSTDQVLKYSGAAWVPGALGLGNLSDVTLSMGPFTVDSQILIWSPGLQIWQNKKNSYMSLADYTDLLLRDGSLALTADWDAGAFDIEVDELRIHATADHRIYNNGSDNLHVQNSNSGSDIIFGVNVGGTQQDFFVLHGNGPNIIIDPTTAITFPAGVSGIFDIRGTWGAPSAFSVMNFQPSFASGSPICFYIQPEFDIVNASSDLIKCEPTVAAGRTISEVWGLNMEPGDVASGQNQFWGAIKDTFNRLLLTGDTWKYRGAQFGGLAVTANAGATIDDIHVELSGGGNSIAGTITQYGIKMSGYGTAVGSTVYAIHSNGGTFAWAADNAKIKIGAGEDAELYYDGTDLILDPAAVGSGSLNVIGDMEFSTSGAGLPFAGLSVSGNAGTTSVSNAGWTQFVHFNTNDSANQDTPDHTNDHITIHADGIYQINVSFSGYNSGGTSSSTMTGRIFVNNGATPYTNLSLIQSWGTGAFRYSLALSGLAFFSAGDTVEVWFTGTNAVATNITFVEANLSAVQVGA